MNYCPKCGAALVRRVRGDKKYLACPHDICGYVYYNNPIPVVAGLIETDQGVLLVQNKGWPEDRYSLVTGFVERKEAPDDAIVREVFEETGLTVVEKSLIGVYPFKAINQIIIAYHITAEGDLLLGDELANYKYETPEKLTGWRFGVGLAVNDWLARSDFAKASI